MKRKVKRQLLDIYRKLYDSFGPQDWWPADFPFEVAVGAILTQSTSWKNVERAITNLKRAGCLSYRKMSALSEKKLAELIRPAGYYRVKAKRLKNFLRYLGDFYHGSLGRMNKKTWPILRQELLAVCGIGQETADSILLYGLNKPIFVIDAYTRRICARHDLIDDKADYQSIQRLFITHLPREARLFNEYHALIVKCAKDFCKKTNPDCSSCPLHEKN